MTAGASGRGPGVAFPPPLLFVAGYALGWWIGRISPIGAGAAPIPVLEVAGAIVAGAGLAIAAWAMSTFALSGTAIMPNQPASTLVVHGPYRYSRNPMYVALTLLYVGLVLVTRTWWALPLLPVVLVLLFKTVIAREERYLGTEFGEAYTDYTRRVRRWI
jgi:protein-S-isoprenylcysteine O-methyltransferase Ste14